MKTSFSKVAIRLLFLSFFFVAGCQSIPSILPEHFLNPSATPALTIEGNPPSKSTPAFGDYMETPLYAIPSEHSEPQIISPTPTLLTTMAADTPVARFSSDLLYISGQSLWRWDYVTGYSSLLLADVHRFSTSQRGDIIALVRPLHIAANGIELFNLETFNFTNKRTNPVVEKIPVPAEMYLSPDGKQIAYLSAIPAKSISIAATSTLAEIKEISLPSHDGEATVENLAWSPDSQTLIWSDQEAIWLAEVASARVTPVITNTIEVHDPNGNPIRVRVRFEEFQWSPTGRYITLKLIPSDEGVRWYALLDTKTSRLIRIPYSEEYHLRKPALLWDEAGNLIVITPSEPPNLVAPTIFVWRVLATQNDLLVPQKAYPFHFGDAVPGNELTSEMESLTIKWPHFITPSLLGLAIVDHNAEPKAAIYLFDLDENVLQKFIDIPANTERLFWSLDQRGAILITQDEHIYYFSVTGTVLHLLDAVFGEGSTGWQWIPPLPRDG